MSARAKPPARSHNGLSSRQLIMLDSMPMLHAPPSSTSISGSMAATWAVLLGLKRPDGLALGATSGRATVRNNFCAVSWAGMRKAMVSRPAEASASTGQSAWRGTTKVNGPGQKTAANFSAISLNRPMARAASISATWQMSGLNCGRALVV